MKITDIVFDDKLPTVRARVHAHGVSIPLTVSLSPREYRRALALSAREVEAFARRLVQEARTSVAGAADVGFLNKAWRGIKKAVRKVTPKFVKKTVDNMLKTKLGRFAVKKGKQLLKAAKKFGETAKKIAQHPAFQAAVFAISQVVPGAGALGVVYVAAMAAIRVAEGVAKKDPKAIAAVAEYAAAAASGNPEAAEVLGRINQVKSLASGLSSAVATNDPLKAIPALANADVLPGLGEVPAAMNVALRMASGMGRNDPDAVKAFDTYAQAASNGDASAASILDVFNKIRDVGKQPPNLGAMLSAFKPAAQAAA